AVSFDVENADVDRRTASLSLPLDLSGKRSARTARSVAEFEVSDADYTLVRREVAARWLKAWTAAELSARQREWGMRRVVLMQRFDALAADRLKLGDINSPERDLAGLALGEAQIQQASLAGNEAAARAALLALTGGDTPTAVVLPQRLPEPQGISPRAIEDLPELRKARAEQDAAEAGIQIAQRARRPDPTIALTGGRVRSGPISDRVIGLSVSIPLPVLNTGRAEIDAARAQAEAAAAGTRTRALSMRARLLEARARYVALYDAESAFRAGRSAAFDERAALLEKLWRAGEIGTSDYLVQLKQSLDTALSGLELQAQAWQAWFDYLQAAGRLTDWIDGDSKDSAP
ncbi:MAG TPA: TolC family protein, partial [Dyella sp.]|uniref:TolC family protein n=1 Tax=Dyella sp. TaxID=1869338 RepID=UPI002F946C53